MSWSLSATGFPGAVIKQLRIDASRNTCQEPEQSIRANVLDTTEMALVNYPPDFPVKVEANGSQGQPTPRSGKVNQLQLAITPLWGFLA